MGSGPGKEASPIMFIKVQPSSLSSSSPAEEVINNNSTSSPPSTLPLPHYTHHTLHCSIASLAITATSSKYSSLPPLYTQQQQQTSPTCCAPPSSAPSAPPQRRPQESPIVLYLLFAPRHRPSRLLLRSLSASTLPLPVCRRRRLKAASWIC